MRATEVSLNKATSDNPPVPDKSKKLTRSVRQFLDIITVQTEILTQGLSFTYGPCYQTVYETQGPTVND